MHTEEYKPIEQILKDRIGLDPAALGPQGVESAVKGRMRRLGIAALSAYAALVATAPEELEALIETIVIPETWFFRDGEPFIFLADFIRAEWKSEHGDEILRILSVPCSTGEEPYSIVMTCLDCGLVRNQFSVAAMDINSTFLRKARNAVYGRNSFRGAALGFRDRFFIADGPHYSLNTDVRECVRFFKINILEPEKLPGAEHYHIIFCRNLLIYLHAQARAGVLAAIDRLLTSGGLLFIGHAEANPFLMEKYEAVKHHGAFAYRKKAEIQTTVGRHNMAAIDARMLCGPTKKADKQYKSEIPMRAIRPQVEIKSNMTLDRAMRLADEGRLAEAAEACAAIIGADRQNASAHFLMGLIKEARGDNGGAEECFKRAIYLDNNFSDAILHLAVLNEESGDAAGAETLRRRAGAINKST